MSENGQRAASPPAAGAGRGAIAGMVAVAAAGALVSAGQPEAVGLLGGGLAAGFLAGVGKTARERGGVWANLFGFIN